jgi:hypothetical protein
MQGEKGQDMFQITDTLTGEFDPEFEMRWCDACGRPNYVVFTGDFFECLVCGLPLLETNETKPQQNQPEPHLNHPSGYLGDSRASF